MKHIAHIAALLMRSALLAFGQTTPEPPKSLAEIARESRKEKKEQAKIALSEETEQLHKPLIPDVFDGGIDNIDEIFKAISDYRSAHTWRKRKRLSVSGMKSTMRSWLMPSKRTAGLSSATVTGNWDTELMTLRRAASRNIRRCSTLS